MPLYRPVDNAFSSCVSVPLTFGQYLVRDIKETGICDTLTVYPGASLLTLHDCDLSFWGKGMVDILLSSFITHYIKREEKKNGLLCSGHAIILCHTRHIFERINIPRCRAQEF